MHDNTKIVKGIACPETIRNNNKLQRITKLYKNTNICQQKRQERRRSNGLDFYHAVNMRKKRRPTRTTGEQGTKKGPTSPQQVIGQTEQIHV